jgi:Fe-S cluster assembly iron-binding protein IscA
LVDYYQNTMSVVFNGIRYTEPPKPREDFFEYQLITPGRLNLGGSILIQQLAIINIDYERVDYTRGRLTSQGFAFTNQNAVAKALFNNNANNIRVGAEINYADLKWRAGFAYYNSPYNTTIFRNNTGERMAVSGGIGAIINKDLFIDFAIINWFGKSYYTPYSGAETATINQSMLNISLGAGYRF